MIFHLKVLRPSDLTVIAYIQSFVSCIWTTQYYEPGEFELVVPYSAENYEALKVNNFVVKNNTDEIAIIEKVRYDFSPEEGGVVIASGRMAIAILERRLMSSYTGYHPNIYTYCAQGGNVENYCRQSVKQQAIEPTAGGSTRIIPNLAIAPSKGFPETANKRISTYLNLYSALTAFLATKTMAHRIYYDRDNSRLVYEVIKGTDRSSSMVFSRYLQNLLSFSFELDTTDYKNYIFVGGDGEGIQRYVTGVLMNDFEGGLNRRETFYAAQSNKEDGVSDAAYINILKNEAKQECKELNVVKNVEAEIDLVNSGLVFGQDYNVGDVILIKDVIDFAPRITTVIESQSVDGYSVDVEFNEDAPEEEEE